MNRSLYFYEGLFFASFRVGGNKMNNKKKLKLTKGQILSFIKKREINELLYQNKLLSTLCCCIFVVTWERNLFFIIENPNLVFNSIFHRKKMKERKKKRMVVHSFCIK